MARAAEATNSSALRSHKIWVSEAVSMFNLPDTAGRAGCADRARHVDLQICFPDLAFVPDHFTASSAKRLSSFFCFAFGACFAWPSLDSSDA